MARNINVPGDMHVVLEYMCALLRVTIFALVLLAYLQENVEEFYKAFSCLWRMINSATQVSFSVQQTI